MLMFVVNVVLICFLLISFYLFLIFSSLFFLTFVSANVKQPILHCLLVERCIIVF